MQNSSIFSGSIKFSSMCRWKLSFSWRGGSTNGVGGRAVKLFVSGVDPWQLFGSNLEETEEDVKFSDESR